MYVQEAQPTLTSGTAPPLIYDCKYVGACPVYRMRINL